MLNEGGARGGEHVTARRRQPRSKRAHERFEIRACCRQNARSGAYLRPGRVPCRGGPSVGSIIGAGRVLPQVSPGDVTSGAFRPGTGRRAPNPMGLVQLAVFARRPRLACFRPFSPSFSPSASVTSSTIVPLRASVNLIVTVAPLPSGISSPERSLDKDRLTSHVQSVSFRSDLSSFDR